jgi:ABC-type glycerol-3-phosphate transport system substrate-binding protein
MRVLLFFTLLLLMLSGTVVVSAQQRITIATKEDNTAYALTKHVEGFKQKTGVDVQVVPFPFGRLNSEIKNDLLLNSPQFDGFMFAPAWITDYVLCDACPGPNVLAPLTDLVKVCVFLLSLFSVASDLVPHTGFVLYSVTFIYI